MAQVLEHPTCSDSRGETTAGSRLASREASASFSTIQKTSGKVGNSVGTIEVEADRGARDVGCRWGR